MSYHYCYGDRHKEHLDTYSPDMPAAEETTQMATMAERMERDRATAEMIQTLERMQTADKVCMNLTFHPDLLVARAPATAGSSAEKPRRTSGTSPS